MIHDVLSETLNPRPKASLQTLNFIDYFLYRALEADCVSKFVIITLHYILMTTYLCL